MKRLMHVLLFLFLRACDAHGDEFTVRDQLTCRKFCIDKGNQFLRNYEEPQTGRCTGLKEHDPIT